MSDVIETIYGATFFACAKDSIGLVRKAQEDSHAMAKDTPNGDLFVVCDGMGGHVGGSKASALAVESILWYLKKEKYDDIKEALNAALRYANDQILGYAQDNPGYRGMGTTVCIVLLRAGVAHIVHVGDSRIYLYLGKERTLHRVTKDHSYVQTLVDAGEITDEEAEHHPNKNQILQALGAKRALRPGYQVVYPKKGDVFLICSDGMSGMTTDACMEQTLSEPISIEAKVEKLVQQALDGGGNDNVTVELVRIEQSPNVDTKFTDYNPPKRELNLRIAPQAMASASHRHEPMEPNAEPSPRRRQNSDYERYMSFVKRYWKWILVVLLVVLLVVGREKRLCSQITRWEQESKELHSDMDRIDSLINARTGGFQTNQSRMGNAGEDAKLASQFKKLQEEYKTESSGLARSKAEKQLRKDSIDQKIRDTRQSLVRNVLKVKGNK